MFGKIYAKLLIQKQPAKTNFELKSHYNLVNNLTI